MKWRTLVLIILSWTACASAGVRPGPAPPATAQVFAPGVISGDNVYRGSFSPDLRELFFFKHVGPDRDRETYRVFRSQRAGSGSWTVPEVVDLGGGHSDLYPAVSPDGGRLVFSSYRPAPGDTSGQPSAYLWQSSRQRDGSWSAPIFLDSTSAFGHYHSQPTIQGNGDLHFNRQTWDYRDHTEWRARWNGSSYGPAEPSPIWSYWRVAIPSDRFLWEVTPGHDDTYAILVVSPRRTDRLAPNGPPDLWVGLRQGAGWSEARPLEAGVNSPVTENFSFFSPDGRALFYVRDFKEFRWVDLRQALGRAR